VTTTNDNRTTVRQINTPGTPRNTNPNTSSPKTPGATTCHKNYSNIIRKKSEKNPTQEDHRSRKRSSKQEERRTSANTFFFKKRREGCWCWWGFLRSHLISSHLVWL